MKMLKKLICLALALTMLLTACAFAEDDEIYPFDPEVANASGFTAQEWFSSSYNRALLSLLLVHDCDGVLMEKELLDSTGCLSNPSFVGLSGTDLIVYYHCVDGDLLIMYTPELGTAAFGVNSASDDTTVELVLNSFCDGGCYQNNSDDIVAAIDFMTGDSASH